MVLFTSPGKEIVIVSDEFVSVIVPTKNERGTVSEIVRRTPVLGERTELVFVDGNSTDGTRRQILKEKNEYPGELTIRLIDQGQGTGKADAVHKGFRKSRGDILMILDGDLTVPPEDLEKFYEALQPGPGRLINGTRMVYPMEEGAMRFLNFYGNRFFATILSYILSKSLTDTLCGTKALYKSDYRKIRSNQWLSEFDPFGDFELLFGAASQNLDIVEIPVKYRKRRYGETEIHRFFDGLRLIVMTFFAFWKFKLTP